MDEASHGFIAECFWPGVTDADVEALDARVATAAERLARHGEPVRFLGSILMRDDEVVLCQFEGTGESVRHAAEEAQVPFERIVEATHSRMTP